MLEMVAMRLRAARDAAIRPAGAHAGHGEMMRRRVAVSFLLLATAVLPFIIACSGLPGIGHDHGRVVAELPIGFSPHSVQGNEEVIAVHVSHGERFSVKVDTSDGPYWWTQQGRPDRRLVTFAGDFNEGSCPQGAVGCRVPYFHTLIARHPGTTTMTWVYHSPGCQATPSPGPTCWNGTRVRFDITIS